MKKLFCVLLAVFALTACDANKHASKTEPAVRYDNSLPAHERQVLANAKQITLRKMDPSALWNESGTGLSAYKTVSTTTLKGEQAHKAANTLISAIEGGDPKPTNCVFIPEYALSVKDGGRNYDYLISYACKSATIYAGSEDVAWLNIEGSPDTLESLVKPIVKPTTKLVKKVKRKAKK